MCSKTWTPNVGSLSFRWPEIGNTTTITVHDNDYFTMITFIDTNKTKKDYHYSLNSDFIHQNSTMNGCILTCDIDGCNRGSSLEETFGNLPHNPNCHLSLTTFFYVQSPFNLIQPRLIPFNLSVKDLNIYYNTFLYIKVPIILLPSLNLVSPSPHWITDLRYFFPDLHKPDAEQHMRHVMNSETWNKPKQKL